VTSIIKALTVATLAATVFLIGQAAPAHAATPCWKKLLNDWYDGRIDNVYPIHCYQDTLKHLPEDISVYSSAREDIKRALQNARAQLEKDKKPAGPNTLVPAETTPAVTTTPATTPVTTTEAAATTTTATTTSVPPPSGTDAGGGSSSPGRKPPPGLPGVAQQLNPSSPSSVPIPLLVLGGLALLLVAAGAVGLVVKRSQGRGPRA
jgi:hypothetical protein